MASLIELEDVREAFNGLRGELFNGVEMMGLPHPVEEAAKRFVRKATYDRQQTLEALLRRREGTHARDASDKS